VSEIHFSNQKVEMKLSEEVEKLREGVILSIITIKIPNCSSFCFVRLLFVFRSVSLFQIDRTVPNQPYPTTHRETSEFST